jgi:hypothetical protein
MSQPDPAPDHELVRAVLGDILHPDQVGALDPRPGTLAPRDEPLDGAAAALQALAAAGAQGWLQDARHAPILHTATPEAETSLRARLSAADAWPVAAEFADAGGPSSRHLRRTSTGWIVTHLTEVPAARPDHLLVTRRLLGNDLQHYLVYHVAYRAEPVGSHEELRPFACRFVRFELIPPAGQPAVTPPAEPPAA